MASILEVRGKLVSLGKRMEAVEEEAKALQLKMQGLQKQYQETGTELQAVVNQGSMIQADIVALIRTLEE